MPRIWSDARLVPEVQEQIRQFAELTTGGSYDQLPGCAAAIVSSMCRADGAFMDRAGDTLWAIARPGIGYDNVDVAAATARGIVVITTPDPLPSGGSMPIDFVVRSTADHREMEEFAQKLALFA